MFRVVCMLWQETLFSELEISSESLWHAIWTAACSEDAEVLTPPHNLLGQAVLTDQETPPPIPRPYSKIQLQAAKKLELKLDAASRARKPEASAPREKVKPNEVVGKGLEKGKVKKGKVEEEKVEGKVGKEKVERAKRKPANGPMTKALKEFIDGKRNEDKGLSYFDALKTWKTSDERAAIVDTLSDGERKRRRF